MSVSLLQPCFLMSKTRSYAQILIGSRLFLTAMAIHSSLRVAPPDLQQGGNSRIPYVHVPAARMSILVYIATAINSSLFLLKKHPLLLRSSGTGTEMGAFSTLFTIIECENSGALAASSRKTGGFFSTGKASVSGVVPGTHVRHLIRVSCCSQGSLPLLEHPGTNRPIERKGGRESGDGRCRPSPS
ncbi:hypothetical protein AAC387_Pa01g2263 [Persea americana]